MKKINFDISTIKAVNKENCFICQNKISPENIIYENKNFIAFLDSYPPTKGYTLLAPKKHYEDITEFSEKEFFELQKLLYKLSKAIKKAFGTVRIYLLNTGELVHHFHFHIIPIYKEMHINFVDILLKKTILELTKEDKKKIVSKIKNYL